MIYILSFAVRTVHIIKNAHGIGKGKTTQPEFTLMKISAETTNQLTNITMGKIYIIRHGQSEDNIAGILGGNRDSSLTELGMKQAESAASQILDKGISLIYSSPLRRALTTANIIAAILGIKDIIPDERLRERDFGILTGKPYSDIEELASGIIQTEKIRYFLNAPQAESFPDTYLRGQEFIREIIDRHTDDNILIVTHGDIGQMIRAAYSKITWEEGLCMDYLENAKICDLMSSDI